MSTDILLGLIGGGGLTTIILAVLGKIKTRHEKQIDISEILEKFQAALSKTSEDTHRAIMDSNTEFEKYARMTIESLKRDNADIRRDKYEMAIVITQANDCEYLKNNPNAECRVMMANIERYKRKVDECTECEHYNECKNNGEDTDN